MNDKPITCRDIGDYRCHECQYIEGESYCWIPQYRKYIETYPELDIRELISREYNIVPLQQAIKHHFPQYLNLLDAALLLK